MGLKKRFFRWLAGKVWEEMWDADRARNARAAMLRPASRPWVSWKLSDCVWVDANGDETVGPPIRPLKPNGPGDV